MGKVVTGATLTDFVQTGKTEQFKADPKPKKTDTPLEVVKPTPIVEAKTDVQPEPLSDDPEEAAEIAKSERFNKIVSKKHKAMKEAQETAAEAERFAETQFNERRLAEKRAAEYEAQLAELRGKVPPKVEDTKPNPEDPKYFDDKGQFKAFVYAEDLAGYASKQAIADDRKAQDKARRDAEAQQAESLARTRVEATKAKYPDYERVLESADVKTHDAVLGYLARSPNIGELSYYLAKNPDFVERINKLNPYDAVAEMGALNKSYEAKDAVDKPTDVPQKASGAPAPITPLSSSLAVDTNTDPSKMNFRQLREYEKQRRKR